MQSLFDPGETWVFIRIQKRSKMSYPAEGSCGSWFPEHCFLNLQPSCVSIKRQQQVKLFVEAKCVFIITYIGCTLYSSYKEAMEHPRDRKQYRVRNKDHSLLKVLQHLQT